MILATKKFDGSLRIKHKLEIIAIDILVNKVRERVKNKLKFCKKSMLFFNTSFALQDEEFR